jgi:hypothetical protein
MWSPIPSQPNPLDQVFWPPQPTVFWPPQQPMLPPQEPVLFPSPTTTAATLPYTVSGGGGPSGGAAGAAAELLWPVAQASTEMIADGIRTDARIRRERDLAPPPRYMTPEEMERGFEPPASGYVPG